MDLPPADDDGAKEQAGGAPLHDIKRHPEDPPGALKRTAREVCDPEAIREFAEGYGIAMQAVDDTTFNHEVRKTYGGVREVREGAIIGPAQAAAAEQLKIVETTPVEVQQIVADRHADGVKADRLETSAVPKADAKLVAAKAEVPLAETRLEAADVKVADIRPTGVEQDTRPGSLMQWVALSSTLMVIVAVLDMIVTTFVLEPAIADLVVTSIQYGTYLISAGVSSSLIIASAAAGFALAAMRLPGRIVGGLMLGIFSLIMIKLVTGLDALREGDEGGTAALTAATLAACFVSLLVGYASATYKDFRMRRDLVVEAGTDLGDALAQRTSATAELEAAKAKVADAATELEALHQQIEILRDSASRADSAALVREAKGVTAEVEASKIEAIAVTGVKQEIAAHEKWAVAIATSARAKARAEELPEGDDIRPVDVPHPVAANPESDGLTGMQKAAIAVLGLGAVGGFVVSLLAVPIGAGISALLMLLSSRRKPGEQSGTDGTGSPVERRPVIGSPAPEDSPLYRYQPDRMTNKYGNGGAGTGESQ
ncbi:hypothetical protein [Paraconexibacter sp. AEG42_29]|uniref:hypothetical protein n=1 Tax=Paraconexibacter sp. AEG42_29 TaxID=2997339 RepID=UPI00339D7111